MIFWVAAVFLLPVSPIWPPRRPFLPYGRPNLALAGLLVFCAFDVRLAFQTITITRIPAKADTGNVHRNLAKSGRVVFEICELTGRQADIIVAIPRAPLEGEVTAVVGKECGI